MLDEEFELPKLKSDIDPLPSEQEPSNNVPTPSFDEPINNEISSKEDPFVMPRNTIIIPRLFEDDPAIEEEPINEINIEPVLEIPTPEVPITGPEIIPSQDNIIPPIELDSAPLTPGEPQIVEPGIPLTDGPIILDSNNPEEFKAGEVLETPTLEQQPDPLLSNEAQIETLDLPTVDSPLEQTLILDAPDSGETVVYQTPESSIAFQVEGTELQTPVATLEPVAEWKEPKKGKKDPIILISTILIIAAIIMAGAYFLFNGNFQSPFGNRQTTAPVNNNDNPKTWPIHGTYVEAENKVCPDVAIELILNEDLSFIFRDLEFDEETENCEDNEITGTYTVADNGNIILTSTSNQTIIAIRKDQTSHAEINIRNTDDIELLLIRTADGV